MSFVPFVSFATITAKVAGGRSTVKATFMQPGTYVIRAFAYDGLLRTPADVTVNVESSGPR